jgi:hypothetical protein
LSANDKAIRGLKNDLVPTWTMTRMERSK